MQEYLTTKGFVATCKKNGVPDKVGKYRGHSIGSDIPNGGCLTIEIKVDNVWYALIKDGVDKDWNYKISSVVNIAQEIIEDWYRDNK